MTSLTVDRRKGKTEPEVLEFLMNLPPSLFATAISLRSGLPVAAPFIDSLGSTLRMDFLPYELEHPLLHCSSTSLWHRRFVIPKQKKKKKNQKRKKGHWEFTFMHPGFPARLVVRRWGAQDRQVSCRFEVTPLVMGLATNVIPCDPACLDLVVPRLWNLLRPLGVEEVAYNGQVPEMAFGINLLIRDEDEWDEYISAFEAHRDYYEKQDLYRGERYWHPDEDRPFSQTTIGVQIGGTKFRLYRADRKQIETLPWYGPIAEMTGRFEVVLGQYDIEKHTSPLFSDRRLPNVLAGFYFLDAVIAMMEKAKLDKIASPNLSDAELIQRSRCSRLLKMRLLRLAEACDRYGLERVRRNPSLCYLPSKEKMLDTDLRRLTELGITPYTRHREALYRLCQAFIASFEEFEKRRIVPARSDEPFVYDADIDYLDKLLQMGKMPNAELRRRVFGVPSSQYRVEKIFKRMVGNI